MISTRLRRYVGFVLLLGACHREPDLKSGGVRLECTLEVDPGAPKDAVIQAQGVLKRRFDALKVDATVTTSGNRITIDLPGATTSTTEAVKNELTTGKLEFREVDDGPAPIEMAPGTTELIATMLDGSQKPVRLRPGGIGPDNVVDASVRQDDMGVAVDIRFNAAGAALLEKLSRENINKPFAIVLDGKILSMPVIKAAITNGRAQITMGGGDLAKQNAEAEALVRALKAGALPGRLIFESIYVVPALR